MHGWYPAFAIAFGLVFAVAMMALSIWWGGRVEKKRKSELKGFSLRSGFSPVDEYAATLLYMEGREGEHGGEAGPESELREMMSDDVEDAAQTRSSCEASRKLKASLRFPKQLALYGINELPAFENALKTSRSGAELFLFDYRYTVGAGKNSTTYEHTVFHFHSKKLKLPAFAMKPENLWDKLTALAGYQDIDFTSHPGFSGKYRLRGPDEPAVRARFAPHILEHFERAPKLCVEGFEDILLVYSPDGYAKDTALNELLHEAEAVFQLFD